MAKTIMHVDMDAFFVSVEHLFNPALTGKPVIVGGSGSGRSVVSSASYEARARGVHSAMPMAWAHQLCPDGIFLPCDGRKYAAISKMVFKVLHQFTPDVEVASIDEAYLDVTGCERIFGPPLEMAHTIATTIKERLGLPASIGIGTGRTVAKIASTLAKPRGILMVVPGKEVLFLAPLPIGRMPGVGKQTEKKMKEMGIKTVGDLTCIDDELIKRVFGRPGIELKQRAMGKESDAIRTITLPKSIGKETTFPYDVTKREDVKNTLALLCEKVCHKLRLSSLGSRTITVKLRYSDFSTRSRSVTLKDFLQHDSIIITIAWNLFSALDTRRNSIRSVGVSVSHLAPIKRQRSLFDEELWQKHQQLYSGIDAVRTRFGFSALEAASRMKYRA